MSYSWTRLLLSRLALGRERGSTTRGIGLGQRREPGTIHHSAREGEGSHGLPE